MIFHFCFIPIECCCIDFFSHETNKKTAHQILLLFRFSFIFNFIFKRTIPTNISSTIIIIIIIFNNFRGWTAYNHFPVLFVPKLGSSGSRILYDGKQQQQQQKKNQSRITNDQERKKNTHNTIMSNVAVGGGGGENFGTKQKINDTS